MKSRAGRTMGSNRTDNGANRIENRIWFDLYGKCTVCIWYTTYWVLGRHNKYQKWFYRKCYNVIWFFIGWSRAIKCNLPMVFNTSRSKTPNFSFPKMEFRFTSTKIQNFERTPLNEVFRVPYFEQFYYQFFWAIQLFKLLVK